MKEFIKGMYDKPMFGKRLAAVVFSVIMMGFNLSWLKLVDMGVDPCSSLNLIISERLGMSFGNWQALFNSLLFILVIFWGKENIGFGTVANMFLVGYSMDFFSWLWSVLLPEGLFESMVVRILVLILALAFFLVVIAIYMNMDLGTAPYDAIPIIFSKYHKKISFRLIRIAFDTSVIIVAVLLGAKVGIVTILMAFTVGPAASLIGKKMGGTLA